jgi:hypothetical protein
MRRERQSGIALLEFTLVGLPLLFILVCVFEVARGMWVYHTVAQAVTEGARFAAVRGRGCSTPPNDCGSTIAGVGEAVRRAGVGLLPQELEIRLESAAGAIDCRPLTVCLSDFTAWPPEPANGPGLPVQVRAWYPFRSALAMFWPGAGPGQQFGAVRLGARARESIQF